MRQLDVAAGPWFRPVPVWMSLGGYLSKRLTVISADCEQSRLPSVRGWAVGPAQAGEGLRSMDGGPGTKDVGLQVASDSSPTGIPSPPACTADSGRAGAHSYVITPTNFL